VRDEWTGATTISVEEPAPPNKACDLGTVQQGQFVWHIYEPRWFHPDRIARGRTP